MKKIYITLKVSDFQNNINLSVARALNSAAYAGIALALRREPSDFLRVKVSTSLQEVKGRNIILAVNKPALRDTGTFMYCQYLFAIS